MNVLTNGINHPLSIFVDKSNRLFYTDSSTLQVFTINANLPAVLFAGTGVAGSSGDGGPATSAELNQPFGIFEDPDGNVYIGTRGDNKIRKVAINGTISTFAGNGTAGYSGDNGPATAASLAGINGLWGDAYGNIYLSDSIHAVVRKIDTLGIITTIAGTGVPGYSGDGGPATAAQLGRPNGIGMDAQRNIYIGDDSVNSVRMIDTNGMITTLVGGNPARGIFDGSATSSLFGTLNNILADDQGDVYIIDGSNQLLRVWNGQSADMSAFSTQSIEQPGTQPYTSVAIGPTGQVYASDTIDSEIWSFGVNYFVPFFRNDSVGQYIYAPLPGHPLTSYYNTYIFANPGMLTSGADRVVGLLPTALSSAPSPAAPLPQGLYSFKETLDSDQIYNGIPLSYRHYEIIPPAGQDSAQDVIQLWFTSSDAADYDSYMASQGLSDPPLTSYSPTTPIVNAANMKVLLFHGIGNTPANTTGPVEEINPIASGYDADANANNPQASPYSTQIVYYYIVTIPVSHGLGGNLYFTTGTLGPLPLTLLSFTAVPQGQDAVLNWTTTNEVGTKDFLVQRSQDTTAFATVGTVDAVSAPGNHSYAYTDKALAPGAYYYRLQMEDQSGHYTYSQIRSVTIGGAMGNFMLYPNPAKDRLYCQVPVTVAGKYIVQLTDVQGKVLQTQEVSLSQGVTTLSFDVSGLAAGVYFITVSDGSNKQTGSFLK